jgi:hypothetical protein
MPSYFTPIFLVLHFGGIVLSIGATLAGFKRMRATGKAAYWLGLSAALLLVYFLQWLVFAAAIAKQNMSLTWTLASIMHLPIVLAIVCMLISLTKLKTTETE